MKFKRNQFNKGDGLKMLKSLEDESATIVFLDPQYEGILKKMKYGRGDRTKARLELPVMTEKTIHKFVSEAERVLRKKGHLFLWMDKFEMLEGFHKRFDTKLKVVDMVVWKKGKIGMGARTRRIAEYCVIFQKPPIRAKDVWTDHSIPDVWEENISKELHTHQKPWHLIAALIEATSSPENLVVDPCAGSFTVLDVCRLHGRDFIGCDLNG